MNKKKLRMRRAARAPNWLRHIAASKGSRHGQVLGFQQKQKFGGVSEGRILMKDGKACDEIAKPPIRTAAEIDSGKSRRGGFTRETLASWGVPWPPPRGWRKRLKQGLSNLNLGDLKHGAEDGKERIAGTAEK